MKVKKFIVKSLLWIVGILVALVLTLPLWVSPVARLAANIAVPRITGAPFHLDRFNLSLDWFSLMTDTIVVKDISIGGLYYEQNLKMPTLSFGGGKDKKPEAAPDAAEAAPREEAPAGKKSDEGKPGKKIIIDHLLLEDIVVAVGVVKLPVPKVELNGIGRKTCGVAMQEAWSEVSAQVMSSAQSAGGAAGQLLNAVKDNKNVGEALNAVRSIAPEKFDKHAEKAVKLLNGLMGK